MVLAKRLLSALALVSAASFPAWAVEPTKIVVEGTYPPWNIQAADGSLSGFDVELAREVCRRAALDCQFTAQVWDSQIPSLLAGKFDAMMTVGPTPTVRLPGASTAPITMTRTCSQLSAVKQGCRTSNHPRRMPGTGSPEHGDKPGFG